MELFVKTLQELTPEELFEIYKLRVSVFVVEQKCPYQEVDDADKVAYHVWMKDEDGIQAYLRVLPKGATFDECSIGRVIAVKRRCGLGTKILDAGIQVRWRRKSFTPRVSRLRLRSTQESSTRTLASFRCRMSSSRMEFRISKCV